MVNKTLHNKLQMYLTDNRKIQTQKDYGTISDMYHADFGSDTEHFDLIDNALIFLEAHGLKDTAVVDLGSGSGVVTTYLLEKGFKNITAVDLTPEFCEIITRKHGNNVDVICEDMTQYLRESKTSSIGGYFANYSIIHVPDEEVDQLFTDIKRTLVLGGLFLMSCHKGTFKGMEQEPYQQQKDTRLTSDKKLETYMNYFTEEELKNRINKAGLKIITMETYQAKIVPGEINVPKIWLIAEKQIEE